MPHRPVEDDQRKQGGVYTGTAATCLRKCPAGGDGRCFVVYAKYSLFERTRISFGGAPSLKVCGSGGDVCWMSFFLFFFFFCAGGLGFRV